MNPLQQYKRAYHEPTPNAELVASREAVYRAIDPLRDYHGKEAGAMDLLLAGKHMVGGLLGGLGSAGIGIAEGIGELGKGVARAGRSVRDGFRAINNATPQPIMGGRTSFGGAAATAKPNVSGWADEIQQTLGNAKNMSRADVRQEIDHALSGFSQKLDEINRGIAGNANKVDDVAAGFNTVKKTTGGGFFGGGPAEVKFHSLDDQLSHIRNQARSLHELAETGANPHIRREAVEGLESLSFKHLDDLESGLASAMANNPEKALSINKTMQLLQNPAPSQQAGNMFSNWLSKGGTPNMSSTFSLAPRPAAGYGSSPSALAGVVPLAAVAGSIYGGSKILDMATGSMGKRIAMPDGTSVYYNANL